jgi:hypothetical protein
MIDDICEAIASHVPFSFNEVRSAYDLCKSFDVIIAACNLARDRGYYEIRYALKEMATLPELQELRKNLETVSTATP